MRESLMRARLDDESQEMRFDGPPDGGIAPQDHWKYEITKAGGNWLKAAKEVWLNSGALFDQEEQFSKILRNAGGSLDVEYSGNSHHFEAGEERVVPADLADSAQYRYGHLGLQIVHPVDNTPKGVKVADAVLFVDEEAKAAAVDTGAKATPHPEELSAEVAPDLDVKVKHVGSTIVHDDEPDTRAKRKK